MSHLTKERPGGQATASKSYHPPNITRAEFEAIANQLGLTIPDGENRRGPNPFTREGKDGFCLFFPECNGTDRKGDFRKSRREMLELAGISAPTAIKAPSFSSRPKPSENAPKSGPKEAFFNWSKATIYEYREAGQLVSQVGRQGEGETKMIRQRRPHPERAGIWIYGLKAGFYECKNGHFYKCKSAPPAHAVEFPEARRVLYRHDEVAAASSVFLCEGEKAVEFVREALAEANLLGEFAATCNIMGAGKWSDKYSPIFEAKTAYLVPDNDDPGRDHVLNIARSVAPFALETRVLELPDQGPKDGADDFLKRSHHISELLEIAEAAPVWTMDTASAQQTEQAQAIETAPFALTDAGNGERFTFHNSKNALYCVERKKWLLWSGKRYEVDTKNAVFVLAKETARKIPDEAKAAKGEDYAATLKWAIKSESTDRLRSMLFQASTEAGMSIETSQLDQNKWLFNVQNGTLDLKTGQLGAHNRADLLTKISPFNFDPRATCPLFLEFLHKIFRGRQGLIQFLQRVIGYSLTGETREQIFLVLHGSGSNGKGVLLRVLLELFGDYGRTIDPKTLYIKHNEGMATDIAELAGRRFLAGSEGDEGKRLDETLIKRMTGDDEMTGERKYENPFTFKPEFQLFFATNHRPEIRGTDHAIWRRVQLLPFEVRFWSADKGQSGPPELRADPTLFEKLQAEMPGILAWAVRGCLEWQREGLGTPDEVLEATKGYREEQDRLREFFIERCVETPDANTNATQIYKAYERWADDNNEAKIKPISFGKQMQERGFSHKRQAGTGRKFWQGIGLKEQFRDE